MIIETVRIVAPEAPGGYIVINKSDLLPEHALYEPPAGDPDAPAPQEKPKRTPRSKQP